MGQDVKIKEQSKEVDGEVRPSREESLVPENRLVVVVVVLLCGWRGFAHW